MIEAKCRQGDLAIINKSIRLVNTGKIVTVSEYLGYFHADTIIELLGEEYCLFVSSHYWVIESSSSSLQTQYGRSMIAIQPDIWLTPITPPGQNMDIMYDAYIPISVSFNSLDNTKG
jgi:hypothetical protein